MFILSLHRFAASLLFVGALAAAPTALGADPATNAAEMQAAMHAFDFFHGRWTSHNHRLVGRLVNSHEWEDFDATVECRPFVREVGNEDSYVTDHWPNYAGISVRFLDRKTRQWSIYWSSNRTGTLEPPVLGGFDKDGVGRFEGNDVHEGKPVRVRYLWTRTRTPHPRWEQAYSADGGTTWETNWIMDYDRLGDAPAPTGGTP